MFWRIFIKMRMISLFSALISLTFIAAVVHGSSVLFYGNCNEMPKICRLLFEVARVNFSRFRDYYNHNAGIEAEILDVINLKFIFPKMIILDIIGKATNSTFFTGAENTTSDHSKFCYPKVEGHFSVWGNDTLAVWEMPCNFQQYDAPISEKVLRDQTHDYPRLIKSPHKEKSYVATLNDMWGFSFCDIVKKEKYSVWQFTIFTSPFDSWSWASLLITFLFVVTLASFSVLNGNPEINSQVEILPAWSALLTLGTHKLGGRSYLFLLWMGACLVLVTFYMGTIQSLLITPMEDDVMKEFRELKERNYTLIVSKSLERWQQGLISYLNSIPFSQEGQIIKELLEGGSQVLNESDVYAHLFVKRGKWVTMGPWYVVHRYVWVGRKLLGLLDLALEYKIDNMQQIIDNNGLILGRRCYVGTELIGFGVDHYAFVGPESYRFAVAFQRLVHAGIFQRWEHEEHALIHSQRVQDRVRIKSPKKFLEIKNRSIKALEMEGKMVTIFLLWSFCILLTILAFCVEQTSQHCNACPFCTSQGKIRDGIIW